MIEPRPFFDRVVVLSLERRPDRRAEVIRQLEPMRGEWGEPVIFNAIDGHRLPVPNGWQGGAGSFGCSLSHRRILEAAILDRVGSLLICEDDLALPVDAAERWRDFAAKLPADWDGIMLGGEMMLRYGKPAEVAPGVVRVSAAARTHCYAVRGRYLKSLYRHLSSTAGHCDHRAMEIQWGHKIYAPVPFIAAQGEGLSDISGQREPVRAWDRWRL